MYLHKILFYITIIVHLKYDSWAYYLTVRQPRRGIFQLRFTTRRFNDIRKTIILLLFCKSNDPPLCIYIVARNDGMPYGHPLKSPPPHSYVFIIYILFFQTRLAIFSLFLRYIISVLQYNNIQALHDDFGALHC